MVFQPLPGGIRVSVEYTIFNKVVVNVYHLTTVEPQTEEGPEHIKFDHTPQGILDLTDKIIVDNLS